MKRNYELVVIFEPEIKTEEKEKLLTSIKKIIEGEGKILTEKDWGRKEFAYLIKKQRMGFFNWLSFSLETEALKSLEKKLKLEDQILRYLIIKNDE